MIRNRFSFPTILALTVIVVAAFVVGCSLDSPTSIQTSDSMPEVAAKKPAPPPDDDGDIGTDDPPPSDHPFELVRLLTPITNARKRTVSEDITAAEGGQLVIRGRTATITLTLPPNALSQDETMTMTLLDASNVDVEITPCMMLNVPATLTVEGSLILPSTEVFMHYDDPSAGWTETCEASVISIEGGEIRVNAPLSMSLDHFSRYAFGSRF